MGLACLGGVVIGYGESRPLNPTDWPDQARALENRRVEVVVVKNRSVSQTVPIMMGE